MNKEILLVVEAVSNEKGVDRESICAAIESALEMATKKKDNEDVYVKVTSDTKSGEYTTERLWQVVSEVEFPSKEDSLEVA